MYFYERSRHAMSFECFVLDICNIFGGRGPRCCVNLPKMASIKICGTLSSHSDPYPAAPQRTFREVGF